eukprot:736758_1
MSKKQYFQEFCKEIFTWDLSSSSNVDSEESEGQNNGQESTSSDTKAYYTTSSSDDEPLLAGLSLNTKKLPDLKADLSKTVISISDVTQSSASTRSISPKSEFQNLQKPSETETPMDICNSSNSSSDERLRSQNPESTIENLGSKRVRSSGESDSGEAPRPKRSKCEAEPVKSTLANGVITNSQNSEASYSSGSRFTNWFKSAEAYSVLWLDLLFSDLESNIRGKIREVLEGRRKRVKVLRPLTPLEYERRRGYLLRMSFSSKPDLHTLQWVVLTSEESLDRFLAKKRKKKGDVPAFHLFGFVSEVYDNTVTIEIGPQEYDERLSEILSYFTAKKPRKQRNKKSQSSKDSPVKPKGSLALIPLENLQSRLREFQAIVSVSSLPLCSGLLVPSSHPTELNGSNWTDLPKELIGKFYNDLNLSQFNAVRHSVQNQGVTLLQGPPGSGKTRTVIALLNALHLVAFNRYYESLISWIKKHYGSRPDSPAVPSLEKGPSMKDSHGAMDSSLDAILEGLQSVCEVLPTTKRKPRILVCAPSNAAVDEIISRLGDTRLYDGTRHPLTQEMKTYTPVMVRIGRSVKIREDIQALVSLDQKVGAFFKYSKDELKKRLAEYITKLDWILHNIQEMQRRYINLTDLMSSTNHPSVDHTQEARNLLALYEKQNAIEMEKYRLQCVDGMPPDKARGYLEKSILDEAQIVFCTLSAAGGKELAESNSFDFCVIDEAAQSTEPEVIIPLRHGIRSVIFVGDPRQLPPTVFLCGPKSRQFERSLFERFENAGHHSKFMLDTQYRMHPEISRFPSAHFYESKLQDGPNVIHPAYTKPYHANPEYAPFVFYNVHSVETRKGYSYRNENEAAFIIQLLEQFCVKYGKDFLRNIGIITPYLEQRNLILSCLGRSGMLRDLVEGRCIDVATVDFFQGREK